MDKFFDNYEKIIEYLVHLLSQSMDAFYHVLTRFFIHAEKLMNQFFQGYFAFIYEFYAFMRWTTIPYNWLIIRTWLWYIFRPFDAKPYLQNVLHYWKGEPGSGKSISSYMIAEEILEETGLASYFTARIEKPRLSEDGRYWYVYHRVIDLNNYYRHGRKVMNFNTDKYAALFKDEMNVDQNPRLNKTKEYNERFIPEHNDEVLVRHLKFRNGMHVFSQQTKTDGQRMETVALYHEVQKTVKGINYKKWLNDGKFEIVPKYVVVHAYRLIVGWGDMKRVLYRRYKIHVDYEKLKYYDTLGEANRFQGLDVDYK